jgi:hypothetical protein
MTAHEDHDIGAELRDLSITMIVDKNAWRYSDPRTWRSHGVLFPTPRQAGSMLGEIGYMSTCSKTCLRNLGRAAGVCCCRAGFQAWILSGWLGDVALWTLEAFEEFAHKVTLPTIAWLPSTPDSLDASLAAAKVYADSEDVHAVYVQRNRINGSHDPLDPAKALRKVDARSTGVGKPVIAGYLGGIGLTVRAIGVSAVDCGPCERQSFDFTDAIRTALPHEEDALSRPLPVRMWLDELGQTVTARQMAAIRLDRVAHAEILCRRACHRFRSGRHTLAVAVHHSLLSVRNHDTAVTASRINAG